MTGILMYVVTVFGLAYVIGHSVITKRPRELLFEFGSVFPPAVWLVLLLECPACLGFWTGLIIGLVWPASYIVILAPWPAVTLAFFTAGSNFLLGRATGLMPHPNPE